MATYRKPPRNGPRGPGTRQTPRDVPRGAERRETSRDSPRGARGAGQLRNFRLTVAYDGGRYRGFEVQPGQATVRGTLEQALRRATGEPLKVHAGGRTDAGVHAVGQVVSFFSRCPASPETLRHRIGDHLPDDIAVREVALAERSFHARHSAIARRYRYQIATEKVPLLRYQSYWVRARLEVAAMREAAAALEGTHDFAAFGDVEQGEDTTVTLQEIEIVAEPPLLCVEVMADRFLWKMVRRIVGGLVAVGRGELAASAFAEALGSPRGPAARALRAHTAPPQGLILLRIIYPGDIKPQAAKLHPLEPA